MDAFDQLAAEHSAAGDALGMLLDEVRAAAHAAYDARRDEIDAAVARWRDTKAALASAVEGDPRQFSDPRTKRHAGIEFGLRKAADRPRPAPETVKLVRELHPDLAPVLLKEVLVGAAAIELRADIRRDLKIRVSRGRDASFVRRVRDDLDGMWANLLTIVGPVT